MKVERCAEEPTLKPVSDIMIQEIPEDWEVHDIKGQNLEQLEEYEKAVLAYKKALALNPDIKILKEKIERCTARLKN